MVRGEHKHGGLKGVFVFSMCFLLFVKHDTNILYVKFLALILTVDSYSKAIPFPQNLSGPADSKANEYETIRSGLFRYREHFKWVLSDFSGVLFLYEPER